MGNKNMESFDKENKTSKEEKSLTKESFLKSLDKIILTVKKPKSPAKGKTKTSG